MNAVTLRTAKDIIKKLDILYGEMEQLYVDGFDEENEALLSAAQDHVEEAASIIEDVFAVSRFDNSL